MKISFQIVFLLFFSLAQAQKTVDSDMKKDTTQVLEFKYRWYLNNIRDSTKVKEDIERAIEEQKKEQELKKKRLKEKPINSKYSRLAMLFRNKKTTSN